MSQSASVKETAELAGNPAPVNPFGGWGICPNISLRVAFFLVSSLPDARVWWGMSGFRDCTSSINHLVKSTSLSLTLVHLYLLDHLLPTLTLSPVLVKPHLLIFSQESTSFKDRSYTVRNTGVQKVFRVNGSLWLVLGILAVILQWNSVVWQKK